MTAARHNRLVGLMLEPSYPWTRPGDFTAHAMSREPHASLLDVCRAAIDAAEILLERARVINAAIRPHYGDDPRFDRRLPNISVELAATFLAFEPEASEVADTGGRFGLSAAEELEAINRACDMLGTRR